MTVSALYRGTVRHRRTRPKSHQLDYRVFWLLLDLAELDEIDGGLRVFSRNAFNLLAFHDRDHGDGTAAPLREQIERLLARADISLNGGPIRLLTMPRVLGYVFNPISLYYCHGEDGRLVAMVYEVTSTFGVRHAYVIPLAPEDQEAGVFRQRAAKALYVSPFMDMQMDYVFRGHAPDATLDLTIDGLDPLGVLITATLAATRRPLTDGQLLAAVAAVPLSTFKVTAAIHWEALKLWLKGVRLTKSPPPATEPVSIQTTPDDSRLGAARRPGLSSASSQRPTA